MKSKKLIIITRLMDNEFPDIFPKKFKSRIETKELIVHKDLKLFMIVNGNSVSDQNGLLFEKLDSIMKENGFLPNQETCILCHNLEGESEKIPQNINSQFAQYSANKDTVYKLFIQPCMVQFYCHIICNEKIHKYEDWRTYYNQILDYYFDSVEENNKSNHLIKNLEL